MFMDVLNPANSDKHAISKELIEMTQERTNKYLYTRYKNK